LNIDKMVRKILPLLIAGVLIGSVVHTVSAQSATLPKGYTAESEVVDLGWTTYANSSSSMTKSNSSTWTPDNTSDSSMDSMFKSIYHEFEINNSWDLNLIAGTILPVNLTIAYPTKVEPGKEAVIYIGVERLPGAIFLNLTGNHELMLYHFFNVIVNRTDGTIVQHLFELKLTVSNSYTVGWNISVKTPIGLVNKTFERVRVDLGTFNMNLFMNHTRVIGDWYSESRTMSVSVSFNASLVFDVRVIADTLVIGNVNISGSALDSDVNKTLVWDSEGVKKVSVKVSDNATENDTITADVALKYKVRKLRIIFYNVSMRVYVNENDVEARLGEFIDSVVNDSTPNHRMRERMKYRLAKMIRDVIENFVIKPIPLPIHRGKTVIRHESGYRPLAEETNNLESSPGVSEIVALTTSITIEVGEAIGGGFILGKTGILLIVSGVIIGLVALVYTMRRGNNKF